MICYKKYIKIYLVFGKIPVIANPDVVYRDVANISGQAVVEKHSSQ